MQSVSAFASYRTNIDFCIDFIYRFLLETAANSPEGILYITLRCRVMLELCITHNSYFDRRITICRLRYKRKNKIKHLLLQFLLNERKIFVSKICRADVIINKREFYVLQNFIF